MYRYEVRFLKTAKGKKAWDEALQHCPENLLYAQSWYLDAVAPRWAAALELKNERITALMPLPLRQKYGQWIVWQPLFCQQLGFFFTPKASPESGENLLALAQNHFRYAPKYYGNFKNLENKTHQNLLSLESYRTTHHLNLAQDYSTLLSQLNPDRQRNLKKALRTPSSIFLSHDPEPMLRFFAESAAHKIRGGVDKRAYETFRRVFYAVQKRGLGELYYAENNGKLHAGAWFVRFGDKLIYLFNAADYAHRRENGRTLILNAIFEKYQNTNLILDFESPEDKNVAYFYESFGAEEIIYPSYAWNRLPAWQRKLHSLVKTLKKRKA